MMNCATIEFANRPLVGTDKGTSELEGVFILKIENGKSIFPVTRNASANKRCVKGKLIRQCFADTDQRDAIGRFCRLDFIATGSQRPIPTFCHKVLCHTVVKVFFNW